MTLSLYFVILNYLSVNITLGYRHPTRNDRSGHHISYNSTGSVFLQLLGTHSCIDAGYPSYLRIVSSRVCSIFEE